VNSFGTRVHGRSRARCKLVIPISETLPLRQAAEAHAAAEEGVAGKILLVA
jgi:hypothetical protein